MSRIPTSLPYLARQVLCISLLLASSTYSSSAMKADAGIVDKTAFFKINRQLDLPLSASLSMEWGNNRDSISRTHQEKPIMDSKKVCISGIVRYLCNSKIQNQHARKLRRIDRTYFCNSRFSKTCLDIRFIRRTDLSLGRCVRRASNDGELNHLCPLSAQTPSSVPKTLSLLP